MSGRHRTSGAQSRGGLRTPVALGAFVALVGITVITVRIVAADASGCSGGLGLRVSAAPEIAPALVQIAEDWRAEKPSVGGRCINVDVVPVNPADQASSLTVYAGSGIDVAAKPAPTPSEDQLPAVWVPDSTAWLTRVRAIDRESFQPDAPSMAASPVVVAMPEVAAKLVGWPNRRLQIASLKSLLTGGSRPLKLGIAEPRRETASLAGAMVLGEALATSDQDLPGLVKTFRTVLHAPSTAELLKQFGPKLNAAPASEQAVLAYDATNPPVKLVAVPLDPVSLMLDYPFAIRSGVSRDLGQAAEQFRSALQTDEARDVFARHAFRSIDGQIGPGFPATGGATGEQITGTPIADRDKVERALGLWTAANSPSRTLALFDLTASMSSIMQTTAGPRTRLQAMMTAAQQGLALFTSDSQVGMWAFGAQHDQLLPVDQMTAERTAGFLQTMNSARPLPSDTSNLYQTMLAAYTQMKDGYDPRRPNIIVVLTDGGDSQATPARLKQFQLDLSRLAEATKPIRVILIGIDVDPAGAADLQAIAKAAGGGYFPMTSPEQIQTIFLKALLRIGPS